MFIFQAHASLSASSKKVDLLKYSLNRIQKELPPESPASAQLKRELQGYQASSPVPVTYTSLQPFRGSDSRQNSTPSLASVSNRCAAVTGKLEVGVRLFKR